ncbi:MAG: hypothetical protein J5606_09660 [Bacteroidales bacterium]|nr:hypothetical protein [Bacteroidales bacterium]
MKQRNRTYLLLLAFQVLFCWQTIAQTNHSTSTTKHSLRICFYNLENFFDSEDDPTKNDNEFTPNGSYHWTPNKVGEKVKHIYQAITAMGGKESPAIIGVCEVENADMLKKLLYTTALKKHPYSFVHYESPDQRGIDVALLYRKDKFHVVYSCPIPLIYDGKTVSTTRDILYVKGIPTHSADTLHLFVNHWPSRYGGYAKTIAKRNKAATLLRHHIDSILEAVPTAKIICMGDFNDYPYDESIKQHLRAVAPDDVKSDELIHLLFPYFKKNNEGTHKYQHSWGILDHLIVNQYFYNAKEGLQISRSATIFKADFLLEDDERNMGQKPFRTNIGMKYHGGFSDHLPVYVDIFF